jgi:hypothetical protein
MNRNQNVKRNRIIFAIMIAMPCLLSLFILMQLYATIMRFA